ncbi:WXG100 family type VII secretion target [Brachybacterium sp. FME24]|uniref:WXG100 family type VII secretion target n=1 Tax=Brachybacterium sp. FME24 TaxID=2742605 RepID=UPI0018695083|nr:hypothetical protein [Brachybacterium sp. FME24]
MTAFQGMDTEQVRAHAERLRASSGEVDALRDRLDAAVHGVAWIGPDADELRGCWDDMASAQLVALREDLAELSGRGHGEADQQDVASDSDHAASGPAQAPNTLPAADASDSRGGYRDDDNPWIPNWLENPAEGAVSDLAGLVSDAIGSGVDTGVDLLEEGLDALGANTEGIGQFQRDTDHLGGILEDWATGERVPTIAELGAAGVLTLGSAGVGTYEAVTGEDTPWLDDRPGGIVDSVVAGPGPSQSPQTLQDLIVQNDALRLGNPSGAGLENGQIGIQEVRGAEGAEPVYIVQVPPTEGADVLSGSDAYGGQGNSRDWGSNLRLVAGQHPAAMDDVRAAMAAAEVPAGSNVMIVGHSQGGIVANHLAADPSFNSSSGGPGTFDVTHTFSVGSPVQTVVPAQGSTHSVNVNHEVGIDTGGGISGDLIAGLDLGGAQVDGGTLGAPNRHEVALPGYPVASLDPVTVLESNHDSVGLEGGPEGGYAGTVARNTASDPTLAALQNDLTGVYLGDGTYVSRSQVVTVGRGEP